MELGQLPNEERIVDRLFELREYLTNFPQSALAPAIREEIAFLEEVQRQWFIT